jgi:hypothetical protein
MGSRFGDETQPVISIGASVRISSSNSSFGSSRFHCPVCRGVNGEPWRPLLDVGQMIDPQTGDGSQAQQPNGLDPYAAVEEAVVLADQCRQVETEGADRACHLPHMRWIAHAHFPSWKEQIIQRKSTTSSAGNMSLRRVGPPRRPGARGSLGASSKHRPKKRLTRMLVEAAQSGTQNSASETHFRVRRPRPVVTAE